MQFEAKLLKKYIKELVLEEFNGKKLRIFDFDDTLVTTDAQVHVTNSKNEHFDMSPGEFAVYKPKPGDLFNYDDFKQLINPQTIKWTGKILSNIYNKYGPSGVTILSARSTPEPIEKFLADAGFSGIDVVALNSADPAAKAAWVDQKIKTNKLTLVEFFDDSHKNIAAVKKLQKQHSDVKIIVRHIVHKFSVSKQKKFISRA